MTVVGLPDLLNVLDHDFLDAIELTLDLVELVAAAALGEGFLRHIISRNTHTGLM